LPVYPRFEAESIGEIEGAVFGLAAQSYAQMMDPSKRGKIVPLYSGKIRYEREPLRRENWQSAYTTAVLGKGDCEDLAAYRVAELRAKGVLAFPVVTQINPSLRHVTVRYLDPKTKAWVSEDPSKRLGM
jgi:hypothetical protein